MNQSSRLVTWQDPKETSSQIAGKTGLEFLKEIVAGHIPQPPIGHSLSFFLTYVEEGFAVFEGTPAEWQYNPMGQVHGGWACTLLDSALGCAVMSALDQNMAYATTQLSVYLTKPIVAQTGVVRAEGRILHRGRRTATAEAKLFDAQENLLAHATTACQLLERTVRSVTLNGLQHGSTSV